MIKIKVLYTAIFTCLLLGCKSGKIENENSYKIINSITKSDKNRMTKIYYKTISSIYDKTLITKLLNENTLKFNLCSTSFDHKKAKLTEKEINILKIKFRGLSPKKIDFSKLKNQSVFTKRKNDSTLYISEPILFRNGEYAIYYSEGRYGGQFTLVAKEDSDWKKVCASMVWIE